MSASVNEGGTPEGSGTVHVTPTAQSVLGAFTPAPWLWWTSNSWKRLKRDDRHITQNVLEPYVCRDGHPDLMVSEADMALIAAAPELLDGHESQKADLQLLLLAIESDDPKAELRVRVKDMIARADKLIAKAQPNDH